MVTFHQKQPNSKSNETYTHNHHHSPFPDFTTDSSIQGNWAPVSTRSKWVG